MITQPEIFTQQVNFKNIILKFLDFKWFFATTIGIAVVGAFFYNKYTPRTYQNSTTILISSEKNTSNFLKSQNFMDGLNLLNEKSNIDNEIGIITSFENVQKTINNLNFQVSYFAERDIFLNKIFDNPPVDITRELYKNSPIRVEMDASKPQPIYLRFDVEILSNEEFILTASGEDEQIYNYIDNQIVGSVDSVFFKRKFKFGEQIATDFMNFKVMLTDDYPKNYNKSENLYFYFNHMNFITLEYRASITTETTTQASTLLKVSVTGSNYQKITDFLNELTNVYLNQNLEKKNRIALSTVEFIDSQISDISDSLRNAETKLRNFRSANQVMDLSYQGQQIFDKMNNLETEKANLEMQKRYYSYLKDYFDSNQQLTDLVAPSSMNVVDPVLTELITQLIQAGSERQNLMREGGSKQNLYLNQIDSKIENLKKTIQENVNNNLNTLKMSMNEIDYRIKRLSGDISKLPRTELQLMGYQRKFKLNDAIYTFLMQKRAEAQIARASNTPDYEVVDRARIIVDAPISPKRKMNYLIAIMIGFIIPASTIMLKDFFNNKITDRREIEHMTNIPIIGHIFHNNKKTATVISDFPKSAISESFRSVRTNLQILSQGKTKQLLVVTSSSSGEGKSFTAINMASAFALFGRKTLLLGFDLRRPMLYQDFGLTNMLGISSYLSNRALLEDIIQPTPLENLDLISAGPIPPNPVELIASDKTSEFIARLRNIYDYIIIDTAPVGVVADTYLLMNYADVNIFVTRQNTTIKQNFASTIQNIESNKISNLTILLNDVYPKKGGYGYGYDDRYYGEPKKESFFKRVFKGSKTTKKRKRRTPDQNA